MSNRIETLVLAMIGAVKANISLDRLTAQTVAVEFSTVPSNANYNALTVWSNGIRKAVKEVFAKHSKSGTASMVRVSRAITVVLNDTVIAAQWAGGKYDEVVKVDASVDLEGNDIPASIVTVPSLQAAYKLYRGEVTASLPSIEKVVSALIAEKYSVEDITTLFDKVMEESDGDTEVAQKLVKNANKKNGELQVA